MLCCESLRHQPRPQAQGFVMPLALGASSLLLLGSASIHTLSLQGRLRAAADQQRAARADQLRSAAQAFAAAAQGPQACLLLLPSAAWEARPSACPEANPQHLTNGVVAGEPWRLINWQPAVSRGTLLLANGDGRQAQVRVHLVDGVGITALGEPQLLGRPAQEEA